MCYNGYIMEYAINNRVRTHDNRITAVEEVPNEIKKWWGTSVKKGVETIFTRLAEQVTKGNITGIVIKWDGKDKVYIQLDDNEGIRSNTCIQLDERVYDK